MRSEVTSRSNCANDSSTFSVSRPIDVVVLNCWVTDTNDTLVLVEQLDQLGEVRQRSGQPVDLVDDDDVDLAGSDILQQALQGRALSVAAGEATIVILGPHHRPAGMGLAADVGLGGIVLGVQRVEILLQPLIGGDAGVDGAANLF